MDASDNDKVCDLLNGLIKLDYDAIEGYEAAVQRADDVMLRNQLMRFLQDHQRHTRNLGEEVRRVGGDPVQGAGPMRMLTEGAVMMGGLMHDHDRGVLMAMSTNEAITNRSYENALDDLGNHPAGAIVQQNREDERRHKAWIDQQLEARGPGLGVAPADGARERPGQGNAELR